MTTKKKVTKAATAKKKTVVKPEVKAEVKPVELKPVVKEKTEAEKIWEVIKNVQIDMFALPDQYVSKYCTPTVVEPSKLYVTFRGIGAVLPALEVALGKRYNVEAQDKFIVISNKVAK